MWVFGIRGKSGFSSNNTAEDVTKDIDGTGLTAIITGSTNGIGLETARILALRGVHVIMAVRNVKAGEKVKQELLQKMPDAKIDVMALDLNSQASIRKFAEQYISSSLPLNILVNNAGINAPPFALSEDGIEQQFAVNHLGPFLLTNLLWDTLKNTASETGIEGRIVNVGSALHAYGYKEGIRFDKINDEESYNPTDAYGQSKLCTMLHTLELARRLKEEGINVTANSLHPGIVATNIMKNRGAINKFMLVAGKLVFKNVQQGASTTCYVALNPNVKGVSGEYFMGNNVKSLKATNSMAKDPEMALKLWGFSLSLTQAQPKAQTD
ncbi:short-chain dehydrogenase TIC 32, chloroplastic-like [Heracleum sosnowskyi]|uniref:Short-chain dehydrogenase TIC 32, chloroplastic-like n=1 Tax=Heracleum sosnowskyi TaxID=360622 RepID=A0AAD8HWM1_9APIA|nr:short-chain dehydrogenase TIC 32, chloroplastic-like [Heracleum sosnowskyi]